MSQSRPKLNDLKRVCPQDLAHCEGYVWHLGTKIGKGSFGEVYLGWTNDGDTEVAVKVVRKEYFKQDPKVRENLEREIRILKLLRGYEYVVQILHVQELRQFIVLVMELCDYDLDHLVKIEPFREETVIMFLYQLAQGMKALRNQNIVHRDLKPGNILIKRHPATGKMMIKLADFGFARHFKDEGNKAIDMTSLAGTPVFMAPEALSCVFHPGEHYDDKVDIWSIGALLYKIIVGQCGFYAQLQDIPRILKHKGDAIAFERAANRKVNYIHELPASVNDRLSESFRDKMKSLLCSMLKLDPRERMTFTEFFETVDDIIRSKIEVINLLHGTTVKIISDPALTPDILSDKVHVQWHIPSVAQVIFSTSCPHYIGPCESISQAQFVALLEKSGGSKGHAKLYLLPCNQLNQDQVAPDTTCFTALKYTVDDAVAIVNLITEQKFSDEIVHMIGYMGSQQRKQLEGLEELAAFTSKESELFTSSTYPFLLEHVHQSLAKATLASQWLNEDVTVTGNAQYQDRVISLLSALESNKVQLQQYLQQLMEFLSHPAPKLTCSLKKEDIMKTAASLCDRAKKLSKARKDQIQGMCSDVCKDSIEEISRVTNIIKNQLIPFSDALTRMWSLRKKSTTILESCTAVNELLHQVSQERSSVLQSCSTVVPTKEQKAPVNHLPAVTPPSPWPQHGQAWTDPTMLDNLKRQVEQLNNQLASKTDENDKLKSEMLSLRTQSTTGPSEVESTLVPSQLDAKPLGDSLKVMDGLTQQLQSFCALVEKMNIAGVAAPRSKPSNATLYPNLLEDYSVIPSSEDIQSGDIHNLLPTAQQLSVSLNGNISSLEVMLHKSQKETATLGPDSSLVKIGRPNKYERGDIVLFTSVKTVKSKSTLPTLLHLQQNRPYILLDHASYGNFNIRPGKTPELFLGKLLETPHKVKFEDHREIAADLGEDSGDFYFVRAEQVPLRFSVHRASASNALEATSKPHSPASNSGSHGHGFWNKKPFLRPHGSKSDRDYV